jgi:hypothetical protein
MPNKIKIAKFVSPTRPLNRPASQRPAVKPAALYLLALRSHLAQTQPLVPRPTLKQTIPIQPGQPGDGIPEPVKIKHS